MTTFVEQRLLDEVAYGSTFGHSYKTDIKELRNGVERRNSEWDYPLASGAVLFEKLQSGHHSLVMAAHHACRGSAIGFRFKDWSNYTASHEVIGFGTGEAATYRLSKTHIFGPLSATIPVYKPVVGTVTIYANGQPIAHSLDYTSGRVQLSADAGAEITWSGEFDIPVRFESDDLQFSVDHKTAGGFMLSADVEVVQIRGSWI
ncbi:DUF2460 domain-containing protein (plasmid) [Microbulbifer sp. CnH-101-G]|uniref:DUF2460 domain-containing protein n=1 Tax=Microbulbifer sp. CnH-101-G TaxID=3243393 RepID=UPI004039439B